MRRVLEVWLLGQQVGQLAQVDGRLNSCLPPVPPFTGWQIACICWWIATIVYANPAAPCSGYIKKTFARHWVLRPSTSIRTSAVQTWPNALR